MNALRRLVSRLWFRITVTATALRWWLLTRRRRK
jgi:hypothetical protein